MKLLILFLSIQMAYAEKVPTPTVDVWKIGSRFYSFLKDKETDALFSDGCAVKKEKCEAYKAVLNKSKVVLEESDRSGGKNPGAVVCKKEYEGEILILKNSAGLENAFCKFKDNSWASASDLY